jgi:hypothetical protein
MLPIIREVQKAGARTLRKIAEDSTREGSLRHAAGSGTRNRSRTCWRGLRGAGVMFVLPNSGARAHIPGPPLGHNATS